MYVVICEGHPHAMNEKAVIDAIDMSDCVHVEAVYRVIEETGKLEELQIHGPWSEPGNPLRITVRDNLGQTVCHGYGTDH